MRLRSKRFFMRAAARQCLYRENGLYRQTDICFANIISCALPRDCCFGVKTDFIDRLRPRLYGGALIYALASTNHRLPS